MSRSHSPITLYRRRPSYEPRTDFVDVNGAVCPLADDTRSEHGERTQMFDR